MRLLIIDFCFLVIFMAAIRTSSSAITQTNLEAADDTAKTARKACTIAAECEDNNVCTVDDCENFLCVNTPSAGCDDGVASTTECCHPLRGCVYSSTAASPCNDDNACTDDSCDAGICSFKDKSCDDGNPCTINTCNPQTGCKFPPDETFCDDQNACTTDICTPGQQDPCDHFPISCDGGNACTESFCHEALGCQYPPKVCDDGNPCTINSCNPQAGCVFTPDETVCDDDDACTTDTCTPGQQFPCSHTTITCDDGNPCTNDICNPTLGCQHPITTQCSAQCPCTGDSQCECNGGTCICVPNVLSCAPRCDTTMTFNLETCGSTTIPCSGTP